MLYGRDRELEDVRQMLERARAGKSSTLLLSGAPGVGKSALLDEVAELAAKSARMLRAIGVESESELPFAALQVLLRPVLNRIDALPEPQAVAVRRALGLAAVGAADRFMVGLAVLTLLSDLAEEEPVVALVDDAHWIDQPSAEALLFVARRLQAEGVVLLFAARDGFDAPGIRRRTLAELDRRASLAVLAERSPGLDPRVRERVIVEAEGNPLALIELPDTDITPIGPLPLPRRLQDAYGAEILTLPDSTRLLLLVVAAEDSGDLAIILSTGEKLGVSGAALTAAEEAGLLTTTSGIVRFRHPLMRAAAYNGLPLEHRMAVHRALAGVLGDDRRAWHLAAAASGPDETVAFELQVAAQRAEERGGHVAAALAYERAADLSASAPARAQRLAASAVAAAAAGRLEQAAEVAMRADWIGLEPVDRAHLLGIRADAAFERVRPKHACEQLVAAADLLLRSHPERAATMLLSAVRMAHYGDVATTEDAALTQRVDLPEGHPLATLLAVARTVAGWRSNSSVEPPAYEEAAAAYATMPGSLRDRLEAVHLLDLAYGEMESVDTVTELIADCRRAGMLGLLPQALFLLAMIELSMSRWRTGYAHADEALRIAEDAGQFHTALWLRATMAWAAAVTGDEQRCMRLVEQCLQHGAALGGLVEQRALRILCLLDIGSGRYAAALDRMNAMTDPAGSLDRHLVPDLIEAATRLGQFERIGAVGGDIGAMAVDADESNHPVGIAIARRCQAMVADQPGDADRLFQEALRSHAALSWPFEHARTELVYGEWLRRVRRKQQARVHLRAALETFERMGARPWAARTRRELQASGDSVERSAAPSGVEHLTAQELQIARLAATGMTNREIAAQLFLSPKTVGHHLYRAFPKLGVATRTELARIDLD